jgi:hypothetical protein
LAVLLEGHALAGRELSQVARAMASSYRKMDTMSVPEACCLSATTPRSTADRPELVSTGGRILSSGS